jgi:hypothetical protein
MFTTVDVNISILFTTEKNDAWLIHAHVDPASV